MLEAAGESRVPEAVVIARPGLQSTLPSAPSDSCSFVHTAAYLHVSVC